MSRPVGDMPWRKPCAHPGCNVLLRKDTRTYDVGFCAEHGGRVTGRSRIVTAQPVVETEKEGVRAALVASHLMTGASGDPVRRVKVSLAKEPWL